MLEVIIGLVFTYLLLSLLATTINELMASWRGWRGHFLEEGLKKILEFKNDKTVFENFKSNALYQQLRNDGSVVGRVSDAPSYLSSEAFVNILFRSLRGEGKPGEIISQLPENNKVRRVLEAFREVDEERLVQFKQTSDLWYNQLQVILEDPENRASNIETHINTLPFDSPMHRVMTEYWEESYRKVDVFTAKVNVWYEDAAGVMEGRPNIQNLLHQIPENNPLRKVLDQIWEDSNNEINAFRSKAKGWYDEVMSRATGWYKKHIQWVTFAWGMVIAIAFNADTFSIYERLSTNSSAREDVVKLATDFIDKSESSITPALTTTSGQQLTNRINSLLNDDIAEVRNPLGLGWRTYREEAAFTNQSLWDWLQRIAGWIVTALAISMGAPFWFDLLKKFVRVRGSGDVPNHSTTPPTQIIVNSASGAETPRIETKGLKK